MQSLVSSFEFIVQLTSSSFGNSKAITQIIKDNKAILLTTVATSSLMWYLSKSEPSKKLTEENTSVHRWKIIKSVTRVYATVFLGASIIAFTAVIGNRLNISRAKLHRVYFYLPAILLQSMAFNNCIDKIKSAHEDEDERLNGFKTHLSSSLYNNIKLYLSKYDECLNDFFGKQIAAPNRRHSLPKVKKTKKISQEKEITFKIKLAYFALGNALLGLYSIPLVSFNRQNILVGGLISFATSSVFIFTAYLLKDNKKFTEKTDVLGNSLIYNLYFFTSTKFQSLAGKFLTPLSLSRYSIQVLRKPDADVLGNPGFINFYSTLIKVFNLIIKYEDSLLCGY